MILHYNKDKNISFCNLRIKFHACVSKKYSKIKNYSERASILIISVFHLIPPGSIYLKLCTYRNWNTINAPLSMRRLCKLWVRQGQVFLLKHCWLPQVQFCFHKTLHLLSVPLVRLTLRPHKKQTKNFIFQVPVFTLFIWTFLPLSTLSFPFLNYYYG